MIRALAEADAAAVAAMANDFDAEDLGAASIAPFTVATVRRDMLGPAAVLACIVAEAEGVPVGYATHLPAYHSETATPARWLENLYVRPSWRRCGIARALMARIARDALAAGFDALYWGVRTGNAGGRGFYDVLGAESEQADILVLHAGRLAALSRLAGS